MRKIDIVIPIYNAYDFVKKCIETVIEYTDLNTHTLVLINDCSPDERIVPLLEKFKSSNNDKNIVLKLNTSNLGFVKTANIGMSNSEENDVILLNSDTEVTKNWVEKLQNCAYSQHMVASVTPLSNNATLASVPIPFAENALPEGTTLAEYAKLIERVSFKAYPEIPTGHGFCMYITRESLIEVGLFDEVLFEKGYGEENDFSYRALNKGYKHLLCDDTFIYHKGTQSFSEEKEEFINSHLKILMEKYPKCFENTDNFVKNYPISYIQKNIEYALECSKRKNILYVVHDFRDLSIGDIGGVTLHIYDLVNSLRGEFNIHILYPDFKDKNLFVVKSYFESDEKILYLKEIIDYSHIKLYNDKYKKMLEETIQFLHIKLIHVHHNLNSYFDIYDIANSLNIPIITTLHDLYTMCPTIQLIDHNNKFCMNLEKRDCKTCLSNKFKIQEDIIPIWQKCVSQELMKGSMTIVPSEDTKKYINKIYSDLKIDVIEHGVRKIDNEKNIIDSKVRDNTTFNIAFVGGIGEHKGLNELKYLVENLKQTNIIVHLFGTTTDLEYNKNRENYIYHGVYDRECIVELLNENNIDLICILSIWPETYSYTLSEAFLANIPVLTYDLGAPKDRVQKFSAGIVLDINTSREKLLSKILDISNDKKRYKMLLDNVSKASRNVKTISDMAKEYATIYKKYANESTAEYKKKKNDTLELRKKILMNNYYTNIKLSYVISDQFTLKMEHLVNILGNVEENSKEYLIQCEQTNPYKVESNLQYLFIRDYFKFRESEDVFELKRQISDKDVIINKNKQTINENNEIINKNNEIINKNNEIISSITNSRKWKMIQKIRIPNFIIKVINK